MKIRSVFLGDVSRNVEKCHISDAMFKNPLNIIIDPDPEADDFLNLINSSLSTDTSEVILVFS